MRPRFNSITLTKTMLLLAMITTHHGQPLAVDMHDIETLTHVRTITADELAPGATLEAAALAFAYNSGHIIDTLGHVEVPAP